MVYNPSGNTHYYMAPAMSSHGSPVIGEFLFRVFENAFSPPAYVFLDRLYTFCISDLIG